MKIHEFYNILNKKFITIALQKFYYLPKIPTDGIPMHNDVRVGYIEICWKFREKWRAKNWRTLPTTMLSVTKANDEYNDRMLFFGSLFFLLTVLAMHTSSVS